MAHLKQAKINDMFTKNGYVRADGLMVHTMYVMQVKTPAESRGEWDLYKTLARVPGDQAFRPMSEGHCPLIAEK